MFYKYTRKIFGQELKQHIEQKKSVSDISRWSESVYHHYHHNLHYSDYYDEEFSEIILISLGSMQSAPELEFSYAQLTDIADYLISEKRNNIITQSVTVYQYRQKLYIQGQCIKKDLSIYYSFIPIISPFSTIVIGQTILDILLQCKYQINDDIYDEKKKITRKFRHDEILLSTKSNWRTLAWEGKTVDVTIKDQQAEIRPYILDYYDIGIARQGEGTYIMSSLDPEELGSKVLQGLALYKIDPKVQKRIDNTRRKQALRREERAKLKAEKLKNS